VLIHSKTTLFIQLAEGWLRNCYQLMISGCRKQSTVIIGEYCVGDVPVVNMNSLTSIVMSQLLGITDIPWSSQRGSRPVLLVFWSIQFSTLVTHWSSCEQQLQWFSQEPIVFEVSSANSAIHFCLQGFGWQGARVSESPDISLCSKHLPPFFPRLFPTAGVAPSRLTNSWLSHMHKISSWQLV